MKSVYYTYSTDGVIIAEAQWSTLAQAISKSESLMKHNSRRTKLVIISEEKLVGTTMEVFSMHLFQLQHAKELHNKDSGT